MGRLFENVTMDIQAERRKAAEMRAELAAVREKTVAAQQELDAMLQERDICKHLLRLKIRNCSDTETIKSLMCQFHLTHAQAEETLQQAFED